MESARRGSIGSHVVTGAATTGMRADGTKELVAVTDSERDCNS